MLILMHSEMRFQGGQKNRSIYSHGNEEHQVLSSYTDGTWMAEIAGSLYFTG